MVAENFLLSTEVDPNSRFSQTSPRVTWADLSKEEVAYVYLDKGVGFFDASFIHTFHVNITAADAGSSTMSAIWMVSNDLAEVVTQTDALTLQFTLPGAGPRFFLQELVGDSPSSSAVFDLTLATDYYMTVSRDEETGANGTLTCKIFTNAERSGSPDATLSVTLNANVDFQYVFPIASHDSSLAKKHSGFHENLDLTNNTGAPQVSTQAPTDIDGTTATGNGTIADLGISSVTAHGVVWDTSPIDTSVVPGSQPNSTDEGAGALGPFTSDITGLTGGLIYYYRAYATNTQGTTYGDGVQWKSGATYSVKLPGTAGVKGEEWHYVGMSGTEYAIKGTVVT